MKSFNKKNNKFYYRSVLVFSSKKVYNDLVSWDLEERKSTRERVYPKLKYNRDFWRGMFDGDGWFSINKNNELSCGLCGSDNVINNFRGFLDFYNIKFGKICNTKSKGLYEMFISAERKGKHGNKGNQLEDYTYISKFHNLLYKDSIYYLDRKYNYFESN